MGHLSSEELDDAAPGDYDMSASDQGKFWFSYVSVFR